MKRIEAAGIKSGRGVRQGMPLSPFFANLLLKKFDQAVRASNISMIRYADDLICLCETNDACVDAHEFVGEALSREGLSIPPVGPQSKSRIYDPEDSAEFLGIQLRPVGGEYLLEVSEKQTQKIRTRILNFADLDSLQRQGITLTVFLRRLDGFIAGYSGAYEFADNAKHLEVVLDSARREALKQLLTKALGINVDALLPAGKRFLGLALDTN